MSKTICIEWTETQQRVVEVEVEDDFPETWTGDAERDRELTEQLEDLVGELDEQQYDDSLAELKTEVTFFYSVAGEEEA